MNRPRVFAVSALLAVIIGVVGALGWLSSSSGGGSSGTATLRIADPLAEALRYVPRSAAALAVVQTDAGAGPLLSATQLVARLPGIESATSALDRYGDRHLGIAPFTEAQYLAGAPLVVARLGLDPASPTMASWVVGDADALHQLLQAHVQDGRLTEDGTYRRATLYARAGGGEFAQRDRVLIAATDADTVRAALDRGRRSVPVGVLGMTRADFTTRAQAGVSAATAVARIALTGPATRALIAQALPGSESLPWVQALRGAGLAVTADTDAAHVHLRFRTDETALVETDLPLAPGPQAPVLRGDAPVVIGVRDIAQSIAFGLRVLPLVDPGVLDGYRQAKDLLARFAGVNLETDVLGTLTGDATITVPDTGGVTLRAETADAGGVRSALSRLARIGQVAGIAGSLGIGPDTGGISVRHEGDDTYTVLKNDEPVVIVGLVDDVLVVSTDPDTDVTEVADATETEDAPATSRGALSAVGAQATVLPVFERILGLPATVRSALSVLPDVTLTASGRAELGYLDLTLDLPVGG